MLKKKKHTNFASFEWKTVFIHVYRSHEYEQEKNYNIQKKN